MPLKIKVIKLILLLQNRALFHPAQRHRTGVGILVDLGDCTIGFNMVKERVDSAMCVFVICWEGAEPKGELLIYRSIYFPTFHLVMSFGQWPREQGHGHNRLKLAFSPGCLMLSHVVGLNTSMWGVPVRACPTGWRPRRNPIILHGLCFWAGRYTMLTPPGFPWKSWPKWRKIMDGWLETNKCICYWFCLL